MYTRKNGHMSTRFEKLVKLSGTNLTQSVYPMITYVQVMNPHLQQFLKRRSALLCQLLYFEVSSRPKHILLDVDISRLR